MTEEVNYYPYIVQDFVDQSLNTVVRKRFDGVYYVKKFTEPCKESKVEYKIHKLHKTVYLALMLDPIDKSWEKDSNQENEVKRLMNLKE